MNTVKKTTLETINKVQENPHTKKVESNVSNFLSNVFAKLTNPWSSTKTTTNPDDRTKQDAIKAFDEYAEKHTKWSSRGFLSIFNYHFQWWCIVVDIFFLNFNLKNTYLQQPILFYMFFGINKMSYNKLSPVKFFSFFYPQCSSVSIILWHIIYVILISLLNGFTVMSLLIFVIKHVLFFVLDTLLDLIVAQSEHIASCRNVLKRKTVCEYLKPWLQPKNVRCKD